MAIIEVENLCKSYGELKAVDDVCFEVKDKEIFGILGPNGAGKTTTLEMVEALRPIDKGKVRVCGLDVGRNPKGVKQKIGVQLQSTSLFDYLTVSETIDLFASFYKRKIDMDEVLEEVSMQDKAHEYIPNLSGGQKQRVSVALALVNDPEVIFLDEPTTGLDPQARMHLWDVVQKTRSKGKAIVLTTHYMEEAETLCDRIAIMDNGKIIETGTPSELIKKIAGESTIEFVSEGVSQDVLEALPNVERVKSMDGHHLLFTGHSHHTLAGLMEASEKQGFKVDQLHVRGGTLEDVFVSLTGRRLRD